MMYMADIFRGAAASRSSAAWPLAGRLVRGRQAKFDGDIFLSFDGAPIEQSGFISPPADGVNGSRDKGRRAGEGLDMDNLAICSDGGAQGYIAFDTGRARVRWIAWSDMINQRAKARLRRGRGWRLRI